jgi:hypothetical protein
VVQIRSSPARRILLGGRVEEDARIDPEVAGEDADVPGIEPASAQEDLRQRRLGQPRLGGDGRPRLAARLDQVPQGVEAGDRLDRVVPVLVLLDQVGEHVEVILFIPCQPTPGQEPIDHRDGPVQFPVGAERAQEKLPDQGEIAVAHLVWAPDLGRLLGVRA